LPPAEVERARGLVVIADLAAARIITVEQAWPEATDLSLMMKTKHGGGTA
jgi:hypothetical protein